MQQDVQLILCPGQPVAGFCLQRCDFGTKSMTAMASICCFIFRKKPWHTAYAASEAAEDEETVTLKWANANWSKAAKVKVFFLDADRKPVAEAVTALIKGKSQKN